MELLEKVKKHRRSVLAGLIALCIVLIVVVGVHYGRKLRENLSENVVRDVMNMTLQRRQTFDKFIAEDRARLHSYAQYFSHSDTITKEAFQEQLTMFDVVDSIMSVICLEDGWYISNAFPELRQLGEEDLEPLRALFGSGVRDNYPGFFGGAPRFCYYETFTFADGHPGLIQKSYDRSQVLESFPLTFYNGQGTGFVLNGEGDVLLRSTDPKLDPPNDNVFGGLADIHSSQEGIDALRSAMEARETGSLIIDGDGGGYLYCFAPVESVEDWYLLFVIPVDVIRGDMDRMLQDTRITLELVGLLLALCVVFGLLLWHTEKEISAKNREVSYQTRLFDIFTTYLSRNTDDMYMMFDHETEQLEYASPNVERVLGVSRDELVDYFWSSDLGADREGTMAYYAEVQALTPGETVHNRYTERVNAKTGEHRYFLENACCADVQGSTKRVAYLSDRTKERKTQDSLKEALRMAQAANEAKTAFLSNMSHDIRTPMNAIIGFLGLMRDEVDNPAMVMEYNKRIDAASQHLLGLINDVLDMNKIESGSTTLSISELNLAGVIEEINTIIRPQTKSKEQTFHIAVSNLVYEHLMGDKMRINQILINLLSNAVKYTPEGGTIELRVEELSQVVDSYSRVRFTVRDNGLGMSEDYLKVIFDPFTREETKVTHEIQGTGLGMAITKSLVDLMGGTIHVESELGKGSTFTVELELRIQEREDDPKFWTHHGVTRMIVTDDDEEVCRGIVKAMAKTGVAADYATDGETAVRMMRENREAGQPYDLILLDWKMPGLDGLETARLIRKNYSDKIPILLLTAYDWSEIEREATEIGVDHFLPKPFFMSTFKEAVRRVMGSTKKAADDRSDVVRGRRVLVVDDIEVNRIILVKILAALGAECDTAGNGQEAVEKFESSQPGQYDLILMDVQMPVMDGYEATRTIRGGGHPSAKTVPIIAMTANAFVEDVRDAVEAGMDAHVAKPVQVDTLKDIIRQVLDSRLEHERTS